MHKGGGIINDDQVHKKLLNYVERPVAERNTKMFAFGVWICCQCYDFL